MYIYTYMFNFQGGNYFFGFMAKKEPQNLISCFLQKKKNGDPEDFPQTKKEARRNLEGHAS